MLNPIELSKRIEKIVTKESPVGLLRKYYRFRPARFYGGIATADAVGCNLNCAFCWVDKPRKEPRRYGEFYSATEVAEKLQRIAGEKGYFRLRVSGAEPTIGKEHLLELIELNRRYSFILETNGILLHDENYVKALAKGRPYVRVALKGASNEEFSLLTRAEPKYFDYQLKALKNLKKHGIRFHPAVMTFSNTTQLEERLKAIDENLPFQLEREQLIVYPHVKQSLQEAGISLYEKIS